jgi:periplasmic protein TonB
MAMKRFLAFAAVFFLAQLALAQTEQAAKPDSQAKPEEPPKHLRVSSGVAEGLKTHNVTPRYPVEARQQGIQGDVLLQAMIDTKGNLVKLKVVQGDPILVAAAVDAVKQWRYRPYILKGEPMEVETTIRVQFHMR